MKMPVNNGSGTKFEFWTMQLYKDLHFRKVEHGKKINGVPFDIVYRTFIGMQCCVECKYTDNEYIGAGLVSKFIGDLKIARIPPTRGYMLTNRDYTKEAVAYAVKEGLSLYNRSTLEYMDKQRQNFWNKIRGAKRPSLEEQIRRTAAKYDE